jgi:hypothetical protein
MLYDRKMVEALFNQQPDDAIGVEYKVCTLSVFVADHTASF